MVMRGRTVFTRDHARSWKVITPPLRSAHGRRWAVGNRGGDGLRRPVPAHLRLPPHAPGDDLVHGALRERGRDQLAVQAPGTSAASLRPREPSNPATCGRIMSAPATSRTLSRPAQRHRAASLRRDHLDLQRRREPLPSCSRSPRSAKPTSSSREPAPCPDCISLPRSRYDLIRMILAMLGVPFASSAKSIQYPGTTRPGSAGMVAA